MKYITFQVKTPEGMGEKTLDEMRQEWENVPYWVKSMLRNGFQSYCELRKYFL